LLFLEKIKGATKFAAPFSKELYSYHMDRRF